MVVLPLAFVGNDPLRVQVSPAVILSIIDHFSRCGENNRRIVGTLLGTIVGNVVEVTNCFPVPHDDSDNQILLDLDCHRSLYAMYQKVNSKESIVGWYSSGTTINDVSVLFHEFFVNECANSPIHLLVDTFLESGHLAVQAYGGELLCLEDVNMGHYFRPLVTEFALSRRESAAMSTLAGKKGSNDKIFPLMNDVDALKDAVNRLKSMNGIIIDYIEKVLNNSTVENKQVGRLLYEAISEIPDLDRNFAATLVNNNVQDLLMVSHLSNIARTNLKVSANL